MTDPTPRTIRELKAWYAARQLPPEDVTRFFIGKNIMEPRAFGIYQDGDCFVIYKNKADGSRAVRYHGPDEAYAVKELYLRLKQEISKRSIKSAERRAEEEKADRKHSALAMAIIAVITIAIIVYVFWSVMNEPNRGYYQDRDRWYYYQDDAWYTYSDDDWYPCDEPQEVAENYTDYYAGSLYNDDYDFQDFELTEYYSSTDTEFTWSSSDAWDSDSTDWSSDW